MIGVDQLSFLVVVLAATVAALTVAVLPRGMAPPVVVIELLLGIVIGPQVLGLAETDDFIEFFSNLGLGMLFFFAGYEIEFDRIRGRPLGSAPSGWALSLALAYGLGGILAAAGVVLSLLYTGSALATTAIGTLIPILRDSGELRTKFGTYLLAAGAVGEFGPILLVTLVLSTTQPLHEAAILMAFVALAVVLALALGAGRLARASGARADARGEQPARGPDRRAADLRPRGAGRRARARRPARRLRRGHDHAGCPPRPRDGGARVEADRCRLRLPGAVLLRHQRHRTSISTRSSRAPARC